jgi:hypothetical protein
MENPEFSTLESEVSVIIITPVEDVTGPGIVLPLNGLSDSSKIS